MPAASHFAPTCCRKDRQGSFGACSSVPEYSLNARRKMLRIDERYR